MHKGIGKGIVEFPGRRELRRPTRRLTFIKNNNRKVKKASAVT